MSWPADRSVPELGALLARATLALGLALAASAGWSASLDYCNGAAEPGAATQDRMIQVAGIARAELEQSGQRLALVSRSGLALQRLDQRYSHAGVSLKASGNTPWSVRQLYYACDEQRPRIFDQGMSGFVMGAHDPAEGYVSIVLLPPEAATALERAALDDRQALALLGGAYSANAHAFSTLYQNCNQWLAELMATAWGQLAPGDDARGRAQQWLIDAGYAPTVFRIGWRPLMWLASQLRWLNSDDHPAQDIEAALFRVSMPESIEAFVRMRLPGARRVELCYTARQVVIRRGWEPIADGCQAAAGDEVIAFAAGPAP